MDGTDHAPGPLGTILSIWAHPDDETYLAAGIMATARDEGRRVVCASATAGERGTDDPAAWPPERLAQVRRWEANAAMAVLGVDEHRIAGLPDGRLAEHGRAGLAWAAGLIAEVRPDTILTFGADGMTFHPDHIAVHEWVTRAWNEGGRRGRLLYATSSAAFLDRFRDRYEEWNMYMTDERPTGIPAELLAVHRELSGSALDRKVAALRAMATQTADLVAGLGAHEYAELIAEEAFIDATVIDHLGSALTASVGADASAQV
jgi:LmbE family N-acetylglucosaminyl deacetylase